MEWPKRAVAGTLTARLAGLPVGLAAVVADQGLGVGSCQPRGLLAASEPLQLRRSPLISVRAPGSP
jgi:hypothetical protein